MVQITNVFFKRMVQIIHFVYILGQFWYKLTTAIWTLHVYTKKKHDFEPGEGEHNIIMCIRLLASNDSADVSKSGRKSAVEKTIHINSNIDNIISTMARLST